MKFNKNKLSNNTEEKSKVSKGIETVSLMMLIIAVTVAIVSIIMFVKVYNIYKFISVSTVYNGTLHRDDETDNLEDVQKLMNEVDNIYEASYIAEIKREEIDEMVINGLIYAYGDEYAVYRDPGETYVTNNSKNNLVMGVGIYSRVVYDDYGEEFKLYLIDVYEDSPAEKAGLEIGDEVVAVNGKRFSKTKYEYEDVIDDIRGEEGTKVNLTFIDKSDNNKEKSVDIVRGKVNTRTVTYEIINNNVGYINIREFDTKTDEEFIKVVDEMQSKGIKKYVFDLRNNGGGVKETAINILDYLLPEGKIMTEVDKNNNVLTIDTSDKNCIEFESVCLTNEYTASAAELMTQVLKDYGKTITIGETTLGKGTVCTWFTLSNGSSIYVSTSKYITSSGADIEGVGIKPDIEMKLTDEEEKVYYTLSVDEDAIIQRAVSELQ